MDNHFNNDETRRVPLPGSESPVPEQFTPEHFDDDREPEQPQKQPKRRRSRRQMNAGCAGKCLSISFLRHKNHRRMDNRAIS